MSNESKQSSPIGVEQAAKDYAKNMSESKSNYMCKDAFAEGALNGFIAGSQWASADLILEIERCKKEAEKKLIEWPNPMQEYHIEAKAMIMLCNHLLNEAQAHPTAVNGDEDRGCPCKYLDEPCHPRCTCVNGASSTGCMFCATYGSLEQRKAAAERIAEKLRPKAAPKADVKSKEEIMKAVNPS